MFRLALMKHELNKDKTWKIIIETNKSYQNENVSQAMETKLTYV